MKNKKQKEKFMQRDMILDKKEYGRITAVLVA